MKPGTSIARAVGGQLGYTQGGKEQVAVQFVIPDTNERITWYGYFGEKSADRTLEALMHAGWDGDDVSELKGLGSKDVELVIEEDTFDGKTKMKVQWVNKPGGGGMKKVMAKAEAMSFAERMKARAMAIKQATPPVDDSDIPF